MKRVLCALAACAALAACSEKGKESPTEDIQAAIYPHVGQPSLTIFTMVNNRSGAGAHSSLLVQGSQSVLFDPAGSFDHPDVPERGDVLFGMSPQWVQLYQSAHARESFHVVRQEIPVTATQAQRAMELAMSYGAVPSAFCASATTDILQQVQGFEGIKRGFYPLKLMEQLERYPGVKTTRYYENDTGDVVDGVASLTQ